MKDGMADFHPERRWLCYIEKKVDRSEERAVILKGDLKGDFAWGRRRARGHPGVRERCVKEQEATKRGRGRTDNRVFYYLR